MNSLAAQPVFRIWKGGIALLGVLSAVLGCSRPFAAHRAELEMLYRAGQYEAAAAELDKPEVQKLYGDKNRVLWEMDRGAVALALNDQDTTVELLERAERAAEVQREKALGDVLGQWAVNDTAAKYIASAYEDIYLNVLKLLAQLEAGRIQGGATVEARRVSGKADILRDTYLKYEEALEPALEPRYDRGGRTLASRTSNESLVSTNRAGEFLESPLGTYLTAVTFMESGEADLQAVAGRRLLDSLRLQEGLVGPVDPGDFEGIGEQGPDSANLLAVAFSGRGPTKYAQRVGPVPLGTVPVYFELPYLRVNPSEVSSARVEIAGSEGLGGPGPGAHRLALVEDLSAVALENHRRALPAIHARTLARYAIKAGISVGLTEMARRRSDDRDQDAVQLAGVLAGLVVLAATEEADLRSWVFLPGQARVGLMDVPPGRRRVRVVYEGFGGGIVHATPWKEVDVPPDGLVTVVTHYWR